MFQKSVSVLTDSYRRQFAYLRLSVTDRCNFKCHYCLPKGYSAEETGFDRLTAELSLAEIRRLVTAFAKIGVTKVRITGGEPTVRRDIVEIVRTVAAIPGIANVALTTNGNRLPELVGPLRLAGLKALNVSVDSLNAKNFEMITGSSRFEEVMAGVDLALRSQFESVKVNAVLLKDTNHHELPEFLEWVRNRPISVRFIELMRTGKNGTYFNEKHLSAKVIHRDLLDRGWTRVEKAKTDGPAEVYRHPSYEGSIGLIAPYAKDFCEGCNRLRVTSRGALRLCLFGEKDSSLRDLLQADSECDHVIERIQELVAVKPRAHELEMGKYGNTWNLAGVGG